MYIVLEVLEKQTVPNRSIYSKTLCLTDLRYVGEGGRQPVHVLILHKAGMELGRQKLECHRAVI